MWTKLKIASFNGSNYKLPSYLLRRTQLDDSIPISLNDSCPCSLEQLFDDLWNVTNSFQTRIISFLYGFTASTPISFHIREVVEIAWVRNVRRLRVLGRRSNIQHLDPRFHGKLYPKSFDSTWTHSLSSFSSAHTSLTCGEEGKGRGKREEKRLNLFSTSLTGCLTSSATWEISTRENGSMIRTRFCSSKVSYNAERWFLMIGSSDNSKSPTCQFLVMIREV